ncbi:MAG TPA: radical SAM protein [Thermodesulfobacteriota bacterium]|jgi:radical SAM protein with 4Fe4S-binding SPASM domain|nr:radical SAM protein [Thermodesulfobacteriota bacterium]
MPSENKYVILTPHSVLKNLEEPYLYDIEKDELYELNADAYQFLLKICRGENPPVRKEDEEFIQFCLSENLIAFSEAPLQRKMPLNPSPIPSLRYLEIQITDRCNLQCRHCYIGEGSHRDLTKKQIQSVLEEFEEIQGLRLLISGGEPLLHPHFWEINDILRNHAFRSVLLSNGTLITKEVAQKLRVHEVQVSLDGVKEGHELLRGKDTFEKTMAAIDHLQQANLRVSVATMIHRRNLSEFDQLASLLQSKHIEEWNVDVPCAEGRLKANQDFWVSASQAGRFLSYGFGGGFHGAAENSTCGAHLCAIIPNGAICKCGLFSGEPVGSIEEGLRTCWARIRRIALKDLTCKCPVMEECRGGCRYRAKIQGDLLQPDLFQCYARGVLKGGE